MDSPVSTSRSSGGEAPDSEMLDGLKQQARSQCCRRKSCLSGPVERGPGSADFRSMRQSINAPVSLVGPEWSSGPFARHAGVASPVVESGEVSATRGHDTSPPRLHFVCSNGPVGEVNRVGCDRPVLSTRHRSVRGVPARSPSFTFAPWSGGVEGGATRPEYVMQITASFGGCRESRRCRDVRNVASGYLGRVCAGLLGVMVRRPVETAATVVATAVARVGLTP